MSLEPTGAHYTRAGPRCVQSKSAEIVPLYQGGGRTRRPHRSSNRKEQTGERSATMNQPPTLATVRLVRRPFRAEDAADVQPLAGERAVAATTLRIPHPYEEGMAEAWIATLSPAFERGEEVALAITRQEDGTLLGAV